MQKSVERKHSKLGYFACVHVLEQRAAVARHLAPTQGDRGELLCSLCWEKIENGGMSEVLPCVRLVCADCALERVAGRLPS